MKLRHLDVLLTVARTGTAKSAAEALFVTESAISKTIKELEDELQLSLFERTRRGMTLTAAGARFIQHAASAMASLHAGVASARELVGGGPGLALRIGAMPVAAATVLPEALRRLEQETPGLTVEVVSGAKTALLERLRKGTVEAVLGRLPPAEDMSGLAFEQLLLDRYVFVVRPAHPLAAQRSMELRDIANFPLVLPTRETVTWQEIQRLFIAEGVAMNARRLETISLHLSRNYTLGGDAVWAASWRFTSADVGQGELVRLPIDTSMLESPLGLISNPQVEPSHVVRRLARHVRNSAGPLG